MEWLTHKYTNKHKSTQIMHIFEWWRYGISDTEIQKYTDIYKYTNTQMHKNSAHIWVVEIWNSWRTKPFVGTFPSQDHFSTFVIITITNFFFKNLEILIWQINIVIWTSIFSNLTKMFCNWSISEAIKRM